MGDTRKRGTPAWRQQAGGGGADRRGPNHQWKAEEARAPAAGGRRVKQLALLGGISVCLTLIVVLVLYLRRPPQPVLVVVAANPLAAEQPDGPPDAERLDVPLDLYGWRTAKQLIIDAKARAAQEAGSRRAPEVLTDPNENPTALPADEAGLGGWADRLRGYDPIVIYVGLHGGTSPADGPVLFAGGRNRVPVKSVIDALASGPVRDKKKVLILDPGRLPPDPAYGQLHDGFVARLKELNAAVAACPNLVVLCGADAGQRGWESEERGATAFGHHVLRGLRGEAASGSTAVISARQLFEFARTETEQFARDNRPAPQTPVLLPEGPEGQARADAIQVAIAPATPAPPLPTPTPSAVPPALSQKWSQHDKLAARTPTPAAYAPRAWRRYRELLLRYEQAVRAGEDATASKLLRAVDDAHAAVTRAADLPPFDSAVNSVAFANLVRDPAAAPPDVNGFALGNDPAKTPLPDTPDGRAAFAARLLDQLAGDGASGDPSEFAAQLGRAAALLKQLTPDQRFAEAHLPVMVREFYAAVPPAAGPVPGEWSAAVAAAVTVRRRGEEAALGLTAGSAFTRAGYPERVWPFVRLFVLAGDTRRRAGEDRLFASSLADQKDATAALGEARTQYEQAAAVAADAGAAFEVRDALFADLPHLGEWVAADPTRTKDHADALVELWKNLHAIAAELDQLAMSTPERPDRFAAGVAAAADRAAKLKGEADKVRKAFQAECETHARVDAALQGEWLPKQQLLATPLVPAEQRLRIIESSRRITGSLLTGGKRQAGVVIGGAEVKVDPRLAAATLGRLTRAALGADLLNAHAKASNDSLKESSYLGNDLVEIQNLPDGWEAKATQVAAALAGHLRQLSATSPHAGAAADATAERFSRSAVPFDRDDGVEPAAANLRLRWRDLLAALAERTADDHWYDERYDPKTMAGRYYLDAANRFLADARKVTAGLPGPAGYVTPPSLQAKLDAPPLTAPPLPVMTWTSQPRETVRFAWPVPTGFPVTGHAVAVRQFEAKLLKPVDPTAAAARPLLPVEPNAQLQIAAELDSGRDDVRETDAGVAASVYFRGQRPVQRQSIHVYRRPDLILSDPRPSEAEKGAFFAVRAERDLDLGQISVLVDMSGSMQGNLDGVRVADWQTGESRFRLALDTLPPLLETLPRSTPLRVRVFSDAEDPGEQSRLVYGAGGPGDEPEVQWEPGNTARLDALVRKLRGLTPTAFTPLTNSILTAVENDFDHRRAGSRTLVVLTDGAEEEAADQQRTPAQRLARVQGLRNRLTAALLQSDVQLLVVRFAINPKSEDFRVSEALFADIGTYKTPGRVYDARDQEQLRAALLDAIRPKLKLERRGASVTPADYPRTGWPSRIRDLDRTDDRFDLKWSPLVPADPYDATAAPARQSRKFELSPRDGDRMVLGFARDRDGVRIRRELFADFFLKAAGAVKFRADGRWVLTGQSASVYEKPSLPRFRALAHLEKVPPHRLPDGARRDADEAADEALVQAVPDAMWWDVAPVAKNAAGEETPVAGAGTVVVRRRYALAAPGWNVISDGWPRDPARPEHYLPARVKVWAADPDDRRAPALPAAEVACQPGERKAVTVGGDPLDIEVAVENQPVGPDAVARSCVVVRVTHPPGRPVYAAFLNYRDLGADHRYYKAASGYTAVFGPIEKEALGAARLRFRLTSLAPLIADEASAVTLTLPRPEIGVDPGGEYVPVPGKNR